MTHKQRRGVLALALAGAVGWSAWLAVNDGAPEADGLDTPPMAQPAPRPGKPLAVAPAVPLAALRDPEPRLMLSRANLFPEQTWFIAPPPPPPTPVVPPAPPQAPPLPFAYMGRWVDAGETTFYLARGQQPVSVRPNQIVDGVWRLEPVTGTTLNFTYLPLHQTRSLRIGE
jgi:hypothetical protein